MRDRDYGGGENTDTRFETESDQMELCDLAEILGTVEEARQIVNRARLWRWKPYGEATIQKLQDGNGAPVNTMQDPIHYPHGTKFMAPGPMGQCHPLPNDVAILSEMTKVAANYQSLHNMYNFDWDPEPGSVQHMIDQRIIRSQDLRKNQLDRYMEAAEEELAEMDVAEMQQQREEEASQQQRQPLAMMASLSLARLVGVPMNVAMAASQASGGSSSNSSSNSSASPMRMAAPMARPFWGTSHAPLASMSMGMGHASRVLLNALQGAANSAPKYNVQSRLRSAKVRSAFEGPEAVTAHSQIDAQQHERDVDVLLRQVQQLKQQQALLEAELQLKSNNTSQLISQPASVGAADLARSQAEMARSADRLGHWVACTLADLFGEPWFGQPPTTAVNSTATGEPLLTSDPQFWQQALDLQVRTLSISFSRHTKAADDSGSGDTPSHISSLVSIEHPLTGGFTFGQQVQLLMAALAGSVEILELQLAALEEEASPVMLGNSVTRAPVKPLDNPQELHQLGSATEIVTNGSSSSSSSVPGFSSAPPPLSDTDTAVPIIRSRNGTRTPALSALALQQRSAALKRQIKRQSALLVATCAFHASPTERLARKLLDRLQLAALVEPSLPKAGTEGAPQPQEKLLFENGRQEGTGAATVTAIEAAEAASASDEIARLKEALQECVRLSDEHTSHTDEMIVTAGRLEQAHRLAVRVLEQQVQQMQDQAVAKDAAAESEMKVLAKALESMPSLGQDAALELQAVQLSEGRGALDSSISDAREMRAALRFVAARLYAVVGQMMLGVDWLDRPGLGGTRLPAELRRMTKMVADAAMHCNELAVGKEAGVAEKQGIRSL
ncbi:MAG: hypothetical protein WDW38_009405 [Sanguina aurantia]